MRKRKSLAVVAPLHVGCAPSEAGPERGENNVVTLLELLLIVPKGEGKRAGRGITVALNVEHHLVHRQIEARSHGFDDAHVGLVGQHPRDAVAVESVALGHEGASVAHVGHREAIDRATLLMELVHLVVDGEIRGRASRTAGLHTEEGHALTVGAEVAVFPTEVFGGGLNEHGTGAVTEDGAGGAIGVIDDARHLVGADYDHFLVATALNHGRSHVHGEEETAACGLKVDAEGIFHAQTAYNDARRGGERIVGRGGSENQAFDLLRVGTGLFQQLLNGLARHVRCAQTLFVEDAALFDTDARHDPLVVGVDHTRKFFVVEDVFGHESAHAGDNGIDFFHERRKKDRSDVRTLSVCQEGANEMGSPSEQAALRLRSISLFARAGDEPDRGKTMGNTAASS